MQKRGQITIFIIIAVIIIALVLIFFLVKGGIQSSGPNVNAEENPSEFLRICLEDSVKEKVETIIHQGGYMENPLNVSFKFEGRYYDFSYLCYNRASGKCVNQQPNLRGHISQEIKKSIDGNFQTCFQSLIQSFEKSGYTVNSNPPYNLDLVLSPTTIEFKSDEEISLVKDDQKRKLKSVEFFISEKELYNFVEIAKRIVEQEETTCQINYRELNFMNPMIFVDKFQTSDGIEIYRLIDTVSGRWFGFAIRGCVR